MRTRANLSTPKLFNFSTLQLTPPLRIYRSGQAPQPPARRRALGARLREKAHFFLRWPPFPLDIQKPQCKIHRKARFPYESKEEAGFLLKVFYMTVKGSLFSDSILCNILSDTL